MLTRTIPRRPDAQSDRSVISGHNAIPNQNLPELSSRADGRCASWTRPCWRPQRPRGSRYPSMLLPALWLDPGGGNHPPGRQWPSAASAPAATTTTARNLPARNKANAIALNAARPAGLPHRAQHVRHEYLKRRCFDELTIIDPQPRLDVGVPRLPARLPPDRPLLPHRLWAAAGVGIDRLLPRRANHPPPEHRLRG